MVRQSVVQFSIDFRQRGRGDQVAERQIQSHRSGTGVAVVGRHPWCGAERAERGGFARFGPVAVAIPTGEEARAREVFPGGNRFRAPAGGSHQSVAIAVDGRPGSADRGSRRVTGQGPIAIDKPVVRGVQGVRLLHQSTAPCSGSQFRGGKHAALPSRPASTRVIANSARLKPCCPVLRCTACPPIPDGFIEMDGSR